LVSWNLQGGNALFTGGLSLPLATFTGKANITFSFAKINPAIGGAIELIVYDDK
jgi:hypothetical protein